MIKITNAYKLPGHRNGAGPHWMIHFSCDQNYGKAYHELKEYVKTSFTPGQLLYIKESSLVMWEDGCHFHARAYLDKDVMLLKLAYG